MRPLTVALARELSKPEPIAVELKEVDAVAYVRFLPAVWLSDFASMSDEEASPRFVAQCLVDETGSPLFESIDEGADEVSQWPASLFQPILRAALAANGLDDVTPGN